MPEVTITIKTKESSITLSWQELACILLDFRDLAVALQAQQVKPESKPVSEMSRN